MRLFIIAFVLLSCTVKEHTVKELDTELSANKGKVGDAVVGINSKNQVVVQEESLATDDLLVQRAVNYRLQEDYENEAYKLKQCRVDLSDQRLGGNGELPEYKEVVSFKDIVEIKEEMGLVDGEIKVVKKSFFDEQYKSEKKLTTTLYKMIAVAKDSRERCERRMEIARRNAGLPGNRYVSEGYFTGNGVWVQTRRGERNLDEAFEISAQQGH